MTEAQRDLLLLALDSLRGAEALLSHGLPGFAASRAYYAMFYVAEAFLEGEELAFSKHSAVIAAFGRHFSLTNRLPRDLHQYLIEGMRARHLGDYGVRGSVTPEAAERHLERARVFLRTAVDHLGALPADDA